MDNSLKFTWSGSVQGWPFDFYRCGFCGSQAHPLICWSASVTGPDSVGRTKTYPSAYLLICPSCKRPTFQNLAEDEQIPSVKLGAPLSRLPDDVRVAYDEARACSSVGAFTATVMLARKILMHVAVQENAEPNLPFIKYVDYLSQNGFVPPKGREWVNKIRDKGNEANHELPKMTQEDAREIMHLTEMLLRFNYEMTST